MNKSVSAILVVAVVLAGACLVLAANQGDGGDRTDFGLTSTKLSLAPGEDATLSPWVLPGNAKESDIIWTTDNAAVATVDGGTVTAVADGSAVITAAVATGSETFMETCEVTVSASPDHSMRAYDPYSDRYDYLRLDGDGFLGGMLGVSFNEGGYIAISLAGYPDSGTWFKSHTELLGSVKIDFSTLSMTVAGKDVGNNDCISSNLNKKAKSNYMITEGNTTYNSTATSPVLYVKGLGYGEYTVTFTLKYSDSESKVVEGTFVYCEGDGKYDSNFEYTRHYVWRSDVQQPGHAQSVKTHVIDVTYDYSDYWGAMLRTVNDAYFYSDGTYLNYSNDYDCVLLVDTGGSVSALSDKLREEYTARYGRTAEGQLYAQYLQVFLQIAFCYEYDHNLYYDCDSKHEDYADIWVASDMTILMGVGDCEDTSILLTSLYKSSGYDSALATLPRHMTSLVKIDSYKDYGLSGLHPAVTYGGKSYYFCETTTDAPFYYYSGGTLYATISVTDIGTNYTAHYIGFLGSDYKSSEYQVFEV